MVDFKSKDSIRQSLVDALRRPPIHEIGFEMPSRRDPYIIAHADGSVTLHGILRGRLGVVAERLSSTALILENRQAMEVIYRSLERMAVEDSQLAAMTSKALEAVAIATKDKDAVLRALDIIIEYSAHRDAAYESAEFINANLRRRAPSPNPTQVLDLITTEEYKRAVHRKIATAGYSRGSKIGIADYHFRDDLDQRKEEMNSLRRENPDVGE